MYRPKRYQILFRLALLSVDVHNTAYNVAIHIIITAITKWGYCSSQLHDADELKSRNTQLYHLAY